MAEEMKSFVQLQMVRQRKKQLTAGLNRLRQHLM
jgi:hypothetical protein